MSGECLPKKRDFKVKSFQKVSKNAFLACFSQVLPAAQNIWPKQGLFSALEKLEKFDLVNLKKLKNFFESFGDCFCSFLDQFFCVFKKSVSKITTKNDSNTVKKPSNHLKLRINMCSFVELHHLKCRITQNLSKLTIIAILRIITIQSARII